jgi:ubiquitin-activating enzyme E1
VSLEEAKRLDTACRQMSPPVAFIRADTRGAFASVFTDFGPTFTVLDIDGAPHTLFLFEPASANDELAALPCRKTCCACAFFACALMSLTQSLFCSMGI